jgi:hypothetical protein
MNENGRVSLAKKLDKGAGRAADSLHPFNNSRLLISSDAECAPNLL